MFAEFKEFIMRGNVLDLAVAVIIGGAFTKIVTSVVDNLLNPLLGVFTGGINFNKLVWNPVGEVEFAYGAVLTDVITFLITAFVVFLLVKAINKIMVKREEEVEETIDEHIALLTEIRDVLKSR